MEHDSLVKQVQQLYDLQKIKNQNNQSEETDLPDNVIPPHSHTHHSPSPPPSHTGHPHNPPPSHTSHTHSPPHAHIHHSPPPHHPPSPPHPSFSSVPPPDFHHGPRPSHAYHSKYDDKFLQRPLRGVPRHPMSNRDNYRLPYPRFSRRGPPRHTRPWGGRGFPPPGSRPHYEDHSRLPPDDYRPPPPPPLLQAPPTGPPRDNSSCEFFNIVVFCWFLFLSFLYSMFLFFSAAVNISLLYKQLEESGLLSGDRVTPHTDSAPPPPPPPAKPLPPPLPVIPEIQLTLAAIRRYKIPGMPVIVKLLNSN